MKSSLTNSDIDLKQPNPVTPQLILGGLVTAIAYYLGAQVGLALRFPTSPISALWPPNAILLAALLLTPARSWWVYLLAAIPAHVAAHAPAGVLPGVMVMQLVTNFIQVILAAAGVRWLVVGPFRLNTFRQTVIYVIVAVFVTPCLVAIITAGIRVLAGWSDDFWLLWRTISLSNVVPFLTLTPALVLWLVNGPLWLRTATSHRYAEAILLAVGLLSVSGLVFSRQIGAPETVLALLYAPLPFLLWIAVRFGPDGVSSALFTVVLLAAWNAIQGEGPFSNSSPEENVLALQISTIALAIPLLSLGALIQERAQAELALSRLNAELELRVAERTAEVKAANKQLELELAEQQRLTTEVQTALTKVKQLEGILPICSFCKRIRNEHNEWNTLEGYISTHSEAQFSHTFCPDCGQIHYPEYYDRASGD